MQHMAIGLPLVLVFLSILIFVEVSYQCDQRMCFLLISTSQVFILLTGYTEFTDVIVLMLLSYFLLTVMVISFMSTNFLMLVILLGILVGLPINGINLLKIILFSHSESLDCLLVMGGFVAATSAILALGKARIDSTATGWTLLVHFLIHRREKVLKLRAM